MRMCRSIQSVLLVVCVLTLSHHIQPSKSQFNQVVIRLLISMLSEIQSIKNTVEVLEGTVETLVEEHEQLIDETASHFAEIGNLINQSGSHLMEIEELICEIHGCHTCGGTGGWRRVAYLNMTDSNTECPSAWPMTNYNIRTCGRASHGASCDSVYFPVSRGGEYSQVCGKIQAYQFGWPHGFWRSDSRNYTIDESYFSGVAVMHGSPRQHIWSFVSGVAKIEPQIFFCPSAGIKSPPFVGDDYFCDSGYTWQNSFIRNEITFHSDDPLWDDEGYHSNSTCCNPPYFTKYLDNPTTDDIELRLCGLFSTNKENVAVQNVEIYVK